MASAAPLAKGPGTAHGSEVTHHPSSCRRHHDTRKNGSYPPATSRERPSTLHAHVHQRQPTNPTTTPSPSQHRRAIFEQFGAAGVSIQQSTPSGQVDGLAFDLV